MVRMVRVFYFRESVLCGPKIFYVIKLPTASRRPTSKLRHFRYEFASKH